VDAARVAEQHLPVSQRAWVALADYRAADPDGGLRRYRLYWLRTAPRAATSRTARRGAWLARPS
jgi:hypothetical protein